MSVQLCSGWINLFRFDYNVCTRCVCIFTIYDLASSLIYSCTVHVHRPEKNKLTKREGNVPLC